MPTSLPKARTSSGVRLSPMSRSEVCSSAARWMIRSSAARSIRAGMLSAMLFRGRRPRRGGEPELRHQSRELAGRQGLAGRLVAGRGGGTRGGGLDEGPEELDRDGEDGGGVVLGGDLGDRLEIPELDRARLRREGAGGLRQRLGGLPLTLGRDPLGPALPLRLRLPRHSPLHLVREFYELDLDRRDLDAPRIGALVDDLLEH